MSIFERAAQERAAATRAQADRPRQRRFAEEPGSGVGRILTRAKVKVEQAAEGAGLDFSGYASTTERGYEMWDFFGPYSEVVSRGAFGKTLLQDGLDVPLVLGHDSMRRIARTTNGSLVLTEDEQGLLCCAPCLDESDPDVAYIAPKMRSGLIDEMSFRFSITSGTWSPDYTEFRIEEVDIHRGDVSIVGYGANPTTTAELREAQEPQQRAAVDPWRFFVPPAPVAPPAR